MICSWICSFMLFLLPAMQISASQETQEQVLPVLMPEAKQETPEMGVSALGYCVIDADTGEVILAKHENVQFHPASITKVMTLLTVVESCENLDLVTTVSEQALQSIAPLSSTLEPLPKPGEQFTIRDLLYGLIMRSGNECGNILAEAIAGDNAAFSDLMNRRAKQAGALHTHFCNSHGLDEDTHLTTAYDMAMITRAAIANPTARKILSDTSYAIPATEYAGIRTMTSGHAMLNGTTACQGVFAGKPGYTRLAQSTLVTACERDGKTLVAAVMHSDSDMAPADTKVLLEAAYAILQGKIVSPGAGVYHPRVSDMTADGFTVTWDVGPEVVRAEFPVWMESQGVSGLTRESIAVNAGTGTISYRVKLADHGWNPGVYTVQAYVYDAAGQEQVCTVKVLGGMEGLISGFLAYDGGVYYIHENGTLGLQWQELAEGVYYFDYITARMHSGWIRGTTSFYMDANGQMHTGWLEEAGKKYYFQAAGDMVTGRMCIAGSEYFFDADGVLQEGVVLPPIQGIHE